MILSDKTLLKMLEAKSLIIEPLEKEQVQPASVDIRLGNFLSVKSIKNSKFLAEKAYERWGI